MDWSNIAGTLLQVGLPALGTAFGGPMGGTIGGALGSAIASALNVEPTPQAVKTAIEADPDKARIRLATIESEKRAELEELQARLADVQDARHTMVGMAQAGSEIAWAPVALSVLILALVAGIIVSVGFGWLREDGIVVGWALGTGTTVVVYWLGSSSGSKRMGDQVRSTNAALATTLGQAVGSAVGKAVRGR